MRVLFVLFTFIILFSCRSEHIDTGDVAAAEKLAALNFTPQERDSLLSGVQELRDNYRRLRTYARAYVRRRR